jgi:hypothetical protein
VKISNSEAREIVLRQQGLTGSNGSTIEVINHLGYVQIDSINVIERAHHHTLWSRCPHFRPPELEELHAKQHVIFEYWAHAMSYLPMQDYRFALPIMQRFREREDCREILAANKQLAKEIRRRITAEGPLSAAEFDAPAGFSGGWWNRKPAKQVLEVLYWQGELMISHRKNFRRYYELSERVLAQAAEKPDTSMPSCEETHRHHVTRVLRTLGVAGKAELLWFVKDKAAATAALNAMIEEKEAVQLAIENITEPWYALKSAVKKTMPARAAKKADLDELGRQIHILSPFDNMVIRRDFIKKIFAFDYVFECYVPEAKRRFGYFSCPILAGTELIGSIDAKADRAHKELIVKNLHLADFPANAAASKTLAGALAGRIIEFAAFNGCARISMECRNRQAKAVEKQLKAR